jgi:hypothetical protein
MSLSESVLRQSRRASCRCTMRCAIGRRKIDRPGLVVSAQEIERLANNVGSYIGRYPEGAVDRDRHVRDYLERLLVAVRT